MPRGEAIHVYVPGSDGDPRDAPSIPGVVVHRGPPLHPDDLTVHKGIPCTSPSRTLIDCAEDATIYELRAMFARARQLGLLDAGGAGARGVAPVAPDARQGDRGVLRLTRGTP